MVGDEWAKTHREASSVRPPSSMSEYLEILGGVLDISG